MAELSLKDILQFSGDFSMCELWQDDQGPVGAKGQGIHPNHDHPEISKGGGAKSPESDIFLRYGSLKPFQITLLDS